MNENELAKEIVDAAYAVYTTLGPGLLESVYEAALSHELTERGFVVQRQVPFPVRYGSVEIPEGFRADLVVGAKVIIELKSVEEESPVHKKQLLTYLRMADKRLRPLVHFGGGRV